jgi:pyridoxine 4-dehydrogenase
MNTVSTTQTSSTYLLAGERLINRLAFGAMRLTGQPGNLGPYADWAGGVALVRRAAELGVDFFDTAHSYGPVANEQLLGEALTSFGDDVVIATKAGVSKRSNGQIIVDASPAALKAQVRLSLKALGRQQIDLLQLHRIDPATPLEDSVAALVAMQREGLIRWIGLSNVSASQLRTAQGVAKIVSVQNRYNLLERDSDALIDETAAQGIAFIPYGPLGAHPMQQGAPLSHATSLNEPSSPGTPAQQALRWLLHRSPNMVVTPGTTSMRHLQENTQSLSING